MPVRFAPHLWYAEKAEEAARFYVSVVPNSRFIRATPLPVDTPSGPPGSVVLVEFELAGMPVMAMTAGPHDPFNDAISLALVCDTQDEIDHLWDGLLQGGGEPVACGWLKDRFGVSWQIFPKCLPELIADPDRGRSARATSAMMNMVKIDIAGLLEAADATG